jgi:hypothetical protein
MVEKNLLKIYSPLLEKPRTQRVIGVVPLPMREDLLLQ